MVSETEVNDGKAAAVLAYFLVGIIWYFVDDKMKKNTFVRHHVQQALVLIIFSIVVQIIASIIGAIIGVIAAVTMGLGAILFIIPMLLTLVPLVFGILGIVYAVQGKDKDLPMIGKYGKKFNI